MAVKEGNQKWGLGKLTKLVVAITFVLVHGCCTLPESYQAILEFQHKHPNEARKFEYIYPIDLEVCAGFYDVGTADYILWQLDQRFGDKKEIQQFIKEMQQRLNENVERVVEFVDRMKKLASGGGVICQYRWHDEEKIETGFLVIKSGEIIHREPEITEWLLENRGE